MKKYIKIALSIALFLTLYSSAHAITILPLNQGGTGQGTSTAGDLLVGTTSIAAYTRCPIGTPGSVLVSSSTAICKMAWQATSTLGYSLSNLSGTVPIANGGTGQTTANNAVNALLPSQTSNSGKYLTTDGSNSSWATVAASPCGSGGEVQFNSSGSFGCDTLFYWDNSNKRVGVGTTTPDAEIEAVLTYTVNQPQPNGASESNDGNFYQFYDGDQVTYHYYAYKNVGSGKVYNEIPASNGTTIVTEGDYVFLNWEAPSGGADGYKICRDYNGSLGIYSGQVDVAGTSYSDHNDTFDDGLCSVTPTSPVVFLTRINYNNGTTIYGLYANSKIYTSNDAQVDGTVRIGADAPNDTSAPFSVVTNASGGEKRVGFFECKQSTERCEFTVANSGDGNWSSNFISLMNHGKLYGSNYYTDHDAGSSIFLLQGADAYQLAFDTYNSASTTFWIGNALKMALTSSGVNITSPLRFNGGAGGSGQVPVSNGSSVPAWTTLSLGNTAWTIGNTIIYNATTTNNVFVGTTTNTGTAKFFVQSTNVATTTLVAQATSSQTAAVIESRDNTGVATFQTFNNKTIFVSSTTAPSAPTSGTIWNDSTVNELGYSNGNILYNGSHLYTATGTVTLASTTALTAFSSSKIGTTTIAANSLKIGQHFTIWGAGYYSTPLGNTATVTVTPSIASSTSVNISTVTTGIFPASASNLPFDFRLNCTVQATGTLAKIVCDGTFNYATALTGVSPTSNSLSTTGQITFNSTVNQTLDVKVAWSTVSTQTATVQEAWIDF